MLNNHYKDILQSFLNENVEFIIIGAYAMAFHGYPRSTIDIDLWINPTKENAHAVMKALRGYGAFIGDLTIEDLTDPDTVFQIGVAPSKIDIITGPDGLDFPTALKSTKIFVIDNLQVPVLSIKDLIKNKTATGRHQDLNDIQALNELK